MNVHGTSNCLLDLMIKNIEKERPTRYLPPRGLP